MAGVCCWLECAGVSYMSLIGVAVRFSLFVDACSLCLRRCCWLLWVVGLRCCMLLRVGDGCVALSVGMCCWRAASR